MAGEDSIMVRQRELKRLHVIRKVMERTLTQRNVERVVQNLVFEPLTLSPVALNLATITFSQEVC